MFPNKPLKNTMAEFQEKIVNNLWGLSNGILGGVFRLNFPEELSDSDSLDKFLKLYKEDFPKEYPGRYPWRNIGRDQGKNLSNNFGRNSCRKPWSNPQNNPGMISGRRSCRNP